MREIKPRGKVYLVGAGCGGEELLTLKALDCIKNAQAIIYDSLVDEKVLEYCRKGCEKIYVGKRYGVPSPTQDEINHLICQKAKEGKNTVRLKGGDPFVFGRGGEEAEALEREKITYDVVPGISSCIAVPESGGIPVTHRDTSRSFHVVTARKSDGQPIDRNVLEGFVISGGTLVVLMGLSLLGYIADTLISLGMSDETKTAVISSGCRENQRVLRTTLKNACRDAEESFMSSPAVIVIGETAGCDFSGERYKRKQSRVLITGTPSHTEKVFEKLRDSGASVEKLCLSKISVLPCEREFSQEIEKLGDGCYTIFTSPNGVEVFFSLLKKQGLDIRNLCCTKVAAVGSGTCEKLKSFGIIPQVVPARFTVGELAAEIAADAEKSAVKEKRAVAFRSGQGSRELNKILTENGFDFTDVYTYQTEANRENIEEFLKKTGENGFDCVTFSSGSGVKLFFGESELAEKFLGSDTGIVCIGEETKRQLEYQLNNYSGKDITVKKLITAEEFNCRGLADAVKKFLKP